MIKAYELTEHPSICLLSGIVSTANRLGKYITSQHIISKMPNADNKRLLQLMLDLNQGIEYSEIDHNWIQSLKLKDVSAELNELLSTI